MLNTKVLESNTSTRSTRVLILLIIGLVSLMMFGLAVTANEAPLYRQLELGMRGSDVSDLQAFLATDSTIYPQGLVTGYFGTLTRTAVSNFQARNGIAVVGRVGPITMAAINAQMSIGMGDRTAPAVNSLVVSTSSNGATISWNTNENASAIVYYSTSPISMVEASPTSNVTIGGNSFLVHTDFRSVHTASLSGLQSDTTYYYAVYVKDANGNEGVVWPATFRTN